MENYEQFMLRLTRFQLKQLRKEKEQTGNSITSIIRALVNKHVFEGLK